MLYRDALTAANVPYMGKIICSRKDGEWKFSLWPYFRIIAGRKLRYALSHPNNVQILV